MLLAALAAGHEEATRHAELTNCRDCGEYAGHLGRVIPRLQPCLTERDHYVSQIGLLFPGLYSWR